MNHPKRIEKYSWSMKDLAEDIGNLDYDALVEHLDNLSKKFERDSINDKKLLHPQVSELLKNISNSLSMILEEQAKPLANLCRSYNKRITN